MTAPPGEGALLDRRTLNRTLLARQHLLQRSATPAPDMIEHLVGLQAQVPRDPYISLWSRLRDFEPDALERLLLDRQAVRMTLMRTTLHLVTARDAVSLRGVLQGVCERGYESSPFRRRLDGVDLDELCAVGASLVDERPRSIAELGLALADRWPDRDREAMAYAVRYRVPLVQVTPRGLLQRSSAPRVTTLAGWLGASTGDTPAVDPSPDEAVLRYLRAFGPAGGADIRAWSWLTGVRGIIERLRPCLRSYRDEAGRELLDVEDGVFADRDEPAPARFLGEYDNVFLSHADRSRITGDLAWGASFTRKGAFFVDGFLAGAWRLGQAGGGAPVVELEARRPLTVAARDEVHAEAVGLLRLLAPGAADGGIAWQEP